MTVGSKGRYIYREDFEPPVGGYMFATGNEDRWIVLYLSATLPPEEYLNKVLMVKGDSTGEYIDPIPDLSAVTVTRDRSDGTDAQTYTVNSDGSVNGPVKSLSPDMRMSVDNPGATITATYNADTKRYIDHKFSELQALALDLKGGM